MSTLTTIRDVSKGFEWSVYEECDQDDTGVLKGTANQIKGGWEPTFDEAKEAIDGYLT